MFETISQIKIFDDLIDTHLQDYYESVIFGKTSKGEILPTVDFTVKYELTAKDGDFVPLSFIHVLKSSFKTSPHFENFGKIPLAVCRHLKTNLKDVHFARIFLTTPYKTSLEYAAPHVDMGIPHWVVLYYVNDSDGDTVFFDKHNNIVERVTPKKGRVVFFNGNILHGGGIPKEFPRCAVNFDIAI